MTLREAILRRGSNERTSRLLEDFERMGVPPESSTEDVIQRVADRSVPWNVRAALLISSRDAEIESVADSMPVLLREILDRELDFEEMQVIESAWWTIWHFAKRVEFDELIDLANHTLEAFAGANARNFDNIASAIAEAVVENAADEGSPSLPERALQWLSALDREWLVVLSKRSTLTPESERSYRLATGKEVKASRRMLSVWLLENETGDSPKSL